RDICTLDYATIFHCYIIDASYSEHYTLSLHDALPICLSRWKTVVKDGLTPRDLPSADIRQLFSDGRIAIRLDGPQIWPIAAASPDRKSTRLNSSHVKISYAVFCLKKKI